MSIVQRIYRTYERWRRPTPVQSALDFGAKSNQYYLVSYPKSGNTWMRMLLANLLKEDDEEIALHNVNKYVPDIHASDKLRSVIAEGSVFAGLPYQFLKTHDAYLPFYRDKQVIYIVRDGRDALTSYYHYLKARTDHAVSLGDVIRGRYDAPGRSWSSHVVNWAKGACRRKATFKYEDLVADTAKEVRRLLAILGWEPDSDRIARAIENSSFEKLKMLEGKHGWMRESRTEAGKGTPFFRKGSVGDWRSIFSPADTSEFWRYHQEGMRLHGYVR